MPTDEPVIGVGFWNTPDSDIGFFVTWLRCDRYDVMATTNVVRVFTHEDFHKAVAKLDREATLLDKSFGVNLVYCIPEFWTLHPCCRETDNPFCEQGHSEMTGEIGD